MIDLVKSIRTLYKTIVIVSLSVIALGKLPTYDRDEVVRQLNHVFALSDDIRQSSLSVTKQVPLNDLHSMVCVVHDDYALVPFHIDVPVTYNLQDNAVLGDCCLYLRVASNEAHSDKLSVNMDYSEREKIEFAIHSLLRRAEERTTGDVSRGTQVRMHEAHLKLLVTTLVTLDIADRGSLRGNRIQIRVDASGTYWIGDVEHTTNARLEEWGPWQQTVEIIATISDLSLAVQRRENTKAFLASHLGDRELATSLLPVYSARNHELSDAVTTALGESPKLVVLGFQVSHSVASWAVPIVLTILMLHMWRLMRLASGRDIAESGVANTLLFSRDHIDIALCMLSAYAAPIAASLSCAWGAEWYTLIIVGLLVASAALTERQRRLVARAAICTSSPDDVTLCEANP